MAAMRAGVDVVFDPNIHILLGIFKGKEKQIFKAVKRTFRKTVTWMKKQVLSNIAADANIPQKAIRPRVQDRIYFKDNVATVWVGLYPVGAHKVGKPRQTKKGTRIGRKHFFESAFPAEIFGYEKVWRRVFRGPGSSKRGRGDGRFPVEVMLIELEKIGEDAAQKIMKEAQLRFHRTLKQEINYAINVEKAR